MQPAAMPQRFQQGQTKSIQTGKRDSQQHKLYIMKDKDYPGSQVFSLQRDKEVAPLVKAVQETKGSQPIQAARKVKMGGMPRLQGNRQAQHEEHQPINEIDDLVIDNK